MASSTPSRAAGTNQLAMRKIMKTARNIEGGKTRAKSKIVDSTVEVGNQFAKDTGSFADDYSAL